MSEKVSQEFDLAKQLLFTFTLHGFQKTSMQDLANSAGLSRQSIYKKFGSKDKCYQWVIHTYLATMYANIFDILGDHDIEPMEGLMKTFDVFIGNAVKVISNPHGAQVLDDTLKATHASVEDWPIRFRERLANYLTHHNLVSDENAFGVAYTLISAGKGLLLEESTRESFTKNIKIIITSVTNSKV
ncbi:TetR/AcrR family transcriptional regulator [Vibrio maritimus]|uniref:TetR/AcrR family transcriptional regulator n=1 Tax=Vibrio maritimus TaxID=990268 RepID=UPI001F185BB9|nr:TetR/AcrR family transcriptional regulator [Vibrio maritimus]